MTRILLTLASLSVVLMITALIIGLSIGDLYHPSNTDEFHDTLSHATVHRLMGIAAALAVVFVESIIVTYFIGTSRWCKEVVETYGFDRAPLAQSNRLKRRAFAWSVLGMLTIVGVIALGAASDPATGRRNTEAWTNYHLAAAIGGIAFVVWTYIASWNCVVANHAIIEGLVANVAKVRRERGLDLDETDIAAARMGESTVNS
jgi:hypothetical protein